MGVVFIQISLRMGILSMCLLTVRYCFHMRTNWKNLTTSSSNDIFVNSFEVCPSNSSVFLLKLQYQEPARSEVYISHDESDSFERVQLGSNPGINSTCWFTGESGSDIQCMTHDSLFGDTGKEAYYSKDLGKSFQKLAGLEGLKGDFEFHVLNSYLLVQPTNETSVWYGSKKGGDFKKLYLNQPSGKSTRGSVNLYTRS